MKKAILILLTAVFAAICAADVEALVRIDMTLQLSCEPEHVDNPPTKRRSGSKKITCEISTEGVELSGLSSQLILQYIIMDSEGECLCSTASEQEFVNSILEIRDSVTVYFIFDDFVLKGYLN